MSKNEKIIWEKHFFELDDSVTYLVDINSGGVSLEEIINCICQSHTGDICHPILPLPPPHITETEARFKYIDDLGLLTAILLYKLNPIEHFMERPLKFRDRTLHYLPSEKNTLQTRLLELDEFCKIQRFVINEETRLDTARAIKIEEKDEEDI